MDIRASWHWLASGAMMALSFVLALVLNSMDSVYAQYCAGGSLIFVVLMALQTWSAYRGFYRQLETDQFVARRTAQADTAEVRLFEASRAMHPETVRLLLKHRMEVWRIREMKGEELLVAVLDADPRITLRFLEYALRRSNPFALMPKRILSDKAHSFDPRGVVTDYEQYDALHALLERRGWLTAGHGNQPGQWIEPWRPELVARRFGLDIFDEEDAQQVELPMGEEVKV